jgi:MFS family permease
VAADSSLGTAPGEARRRLAASLEAVHRVLLNPDLRRLEIAWTLATAAEWALIVALLVYAYERGGTFGVGLLGVARTLPTLIGVPLASTLADRHSRIRVMLGCYLVALATAAVAAIALAADAPLLIVLVIAAVNAVATTAIRPLQNTIIPSLARSPEELVAANVATSTGEGIGVLVGPGLGGILMVFGPAVVAVAGAVGMVLATTAFTQIRDRPVRLRPSANAVGHPGRQPSRSNFVAGVAALRSLPTPFLVMAVFGVQPFVRGVLTVLIVAASIELLGLGDPGVGLLNAAIGAGAIIGAVATILLIGRARLAMVFLGALALWGAPISVVGLLPVAWVAVVAMGVIGSANAVLDVAGFTTLQRTIPNDIRASVLGLFEGYVAAMTGLGGLAAPVLLAVFGIEGALIVTGAILPVLAVLSSRFLVRVDDIALVPERQLRLLRGVAMFAPLPITTIEQLADNLVPVRFVAGEILMRAGDPGDRFILIETGTVEVEQDGATIRSIGPGGSVGEIALLRGVPRTATVRAATDVRAFALESASFIAAVTGDRDAAGFADRVVDARLANAEASTSRS